MTAQSAHLARIAASFVLGAGSVQILRIPGIMPGLNDILTARGRAGQMVAGKRRHDSYADLKRAWMEKICIYVLQQGIKPVAKARFRFTWIETHNRRDPDNIAAGGRKLILDGLVKSKTIRNDNRRYVLGWEDRFMTDPKRAGVIIEIVEEVAS